MDKTLTAFGYGMCIFSMDVLLDFLKTEKIRTKKIVQYLQNEPEIYLKAIENGIWLPFVGINHEKYCISLGDVAPSFEKGWEEKFAHKEFNITVKDALWITNISSFHPFDKTKYIDTYEVSYQNEALVKNKFKTITSFSGFKFDVPTGKYKVTVKGYRKKKRLAFPNANYAFSFSLRRVDEFDSFCNPREDELYDFNVANMT